MQAQQTGSDGEGMFTRCRPSCTVQKLLTCCERCLSGMGTPRCPFTQVVNAIDSERIELYNSNVAMYPRASNPGPPQTQPSHVLITSRDEDKRLYHQHKSHSSHT